MHILFVHKNFPAQFRYLMPYLVREHGVECTFVSEKAATNVQDDVRRIQYRPRFLASKLSSYCGRTFENQMWRSQAIVEALAARKDVRPDLVVAHSGFFTTAFLRDLYDCPIVNLFEYFYSPDGGDYGFRSDLFDSSLIERIRTRARNSAFLLDLENCDLGYCPTQWQKSRFPEAFQSKLQVAHDGVDTDYWCPGQVEDDAFGIDSNTKVITYVSRGFESIRGFDIFMRFAKRICDLRDDVIFLVAGSDRISYGADSKITGGQSFKDWVLSKDEYDLDRIRFLGYVPKDTVRAMYRRSDLHIYLTAPFVISWSPLDAMASGCLVMGSNTGPVREVIQPGVNGLLVDFFDVDEMVQKANDVLDYPARFSPLRGNALSRIHEQFGLTYGLPNLWSVISSALAAKTLS